MRTVIVVFSLLFAIAAPASAQLSLSFGMPGLSIGINVPVYPRLVRVPGYPVYYAPGLQTNFFFYDGLYWVYQDDDWYASDWYDGPWGQVQPEAVPLFILRVPVRYYRSPPTYFHGWRADAPPRWGDHWGNDWQHQRRGWDRWNRNAVPAPAPLPNYQRPYSAERYPRPEQQQALRERNYRYQPREAIVRQHLQAPAPQQWEPRGAPPPRRDQRDQRDQWDQRDQRERREPREAGPARQPVPQAPGEHRPRQQPAPVVVPQPRQPDGAADQDRPPARGPQHKPDKGQREQGRGRDNGDERDSDRRK